MYRRLASPVLVILAVASFVASATAAKYEVSVKTDRPSAVYETGEDVRFLVEVTKDGEPLTTGSIDYILTEDGLNRVLAGSVSLEKRPAVVCGKLDAPGVLQCEVVYRPAEGTPVTRLAGAAVAPFEIKPSLPAPDDFGAFWAAQKERLAKVPMRASMTPVKVDDEGIECFDVQVDCVDGCPGLGVLRPTERSGRRKASRFCCGSRAPGFAVEVSAMRSAGRRTASFRWISTPTVSKTENRPHSMMN